jgi:hypothetical protein
MILSILLPMHVTAIVALINSVVRAIHMLVPMMRGDELFFGIDRGVLLRTGG